MSDELPAPPSSGWSTQPMGSGNYATGNERMLTLVTHLRAGMTTFCGISLLGSYRPLWTDDNDDANCPECVMNALPLTILLPEKGFRL